MIVGLVITQFWSTLKPFFGGDLFFTNGLIPGFVLNLILAYVISLATNPLRRTKDALPITNEASRGIQTK